MCFCVCECVCEVCVRVYMYMCVWPCSTSTATLDLLHLPARIAFGPRTSIISPSTLWRKKAGQKLAPVELKEGNQKRERGPH